jgi:catechol 2,3-dioxygenase-like lactoylglutathione lyase family enzyme
MQLDHVNIKTDNLEGTTTFFRDVIGLEVGPRPNFPFPGVWLYHEGRPIVHLKSPGEPGANSTGPLDHVAFFTEKLDEVLAALDAKRLGYDLRVLPDGFLRQCFVRDPNGIMLEITGT